MSAPWFSSMRRLPDRLLAYLRRRFDRPHLLPRDATIEVTGWLAEVPGQPGKIEPMVHFDPAGLSPQSQAKLLTTMAAVILAQAGEIEVGIVRAPAAPPPPTPAQPYSIARPHPYQRVKGKR